MSDFNSISDVKKLIEKNNKEKGINAEVSSADIWSVKSALEQYDSKMARRASERSKSSSSSFITETDSNSFSSKAESSSKSFKQESSSTSFNKASDALKNNGFNISGAELKRTSLSVRDEKRLNNFIAQDGSYQRRAARLNKAIDKNAKAEKKLDKRKKKKGYKKKTDKDGNVSYVKERKFISSKKAGKALDAASFSSFVVTKASVDGQFGKKDEMAKSFSTAGKTAIASAVLVKKSASKFLDKRAEKNAANRKKQLKKAQKKLNQRKSRLTYEYRHNIAKNTPFINVFKKTDIAEKKTKIKALLILGGLVLLLVALLGSCVILGEAIASSASASVGAFLAKPEELDQADAYFSRGEQLIIREAAALAESNTFAMYPSAQQLPDGAWVYIDDSGVEWHLFRDFNLGPIGHNPTTLLAYLTIIFDDFEIDENDLLTDEVANHILNPLLWECYDGITYIPPMTQVGADTPFDLDADHFSAAYLLSQGPSGTVVNHHTSNQYTAYRYENDPVTNIPTLVSYELIDFWYDIKGDFRSLEDVVKERLIDLDLDDGRLELFDYTKGALFFAKDIFGNDIDIRDRILRGYGYTNTGNTNYITKQAGWQPAGINQPNTFEEADDVILDCRTTDGTSATLIYAGVSGTVTSAGGGEITIETDKGSFGKKWCIKYSGLDRVWVSTGDSVVSDTYIALDNDTISVQTFYVDLLGNETYMNPIVYIK